AAMDPVTYLFVPATRTDRVAKAFAAGAHAVIVDLEDAVDPADKPSARLALDLFLAGSGARPWVRVNAVTTPWFAEDLAMLKKHSTALAGVMLSKTESFADIDAAACGLPVMALVESAKGMLALADICRHRHVVRLAFGSADLSRDLGCEDARDVLAPARLQLVMHSSSRQLPPPVDGVTFSLDQPERCREDASAAARMGFGAKLCVHPSQLAPVLQGFAPSAAQIAWATQILEVAKAGSGAQRWNGEMVDRPVIERATRILQRQAALGPEH
ncbi:MAG: HpcH/HpaI aldolase, partial [Polaromonas sp.]|nr:HpcH/HpaI aldolase [Polaromonas sp.]